MFAELQAHPSIVAWSLANEIAGQGHPGGQSEHIQALTRQLHELDPGRLVAVDLWGRHGPRFACPLYAELDVIGFHRLPTAGTRSAGRTSAALRCVDLACPPPPGTTLVIFPDKVLVVTESGRPQPVPNPPAS